MTVAALHAVDDLDLNARRWFRFWGWRDGDAIELQTLKVPTGRGSFKVNRFAHTHDIETAIRLAHEADQWNAPGVYVIANAVKPEVATRAETGKWHDAEKGEVTSDNDIAERRVLFIDVDWKRSRGTSTTDAELAQTLEVAESIADRLAQIVSPAAVATGMSGNCASVFVALDRIAESEEVAAIVAGALAALRLSYERGKVEIDTSVCDAKRLCPAFGTTKRKGAAGLTDRPHRATAFTCADTVERVDLDGLKRLLSELRAPLTVEQNAEVDKAMGVKPAKPTATLQEGPSVAQRRDDSDGDSPWKKANAIDPSKVLEWLGVTSCPGCGAEDGSFAVVRGGTKCQHNSCRAKGKSGFRTNVDLVVEVKKCQQPIEAVRLIGERFGFEVAKSSGKTAAKSSEPEAPYVVCAAEVEMKAIAWMWRGRIAIGMITILDGDPGLGKSTITADLTARATKGEPMPGDALGSDPINVLIVSFEEHLECVIKPRLHASRADQARVFVWNLDAHPFNLRDSLEPLIKVVDEKQIHLLIVDPLMAALPGDLNANRDQDVRRALAPIAKLAETRDLAVVFVRHLNKTGTGSALYRGGGSIGIAGAARCVLTLGADPDAEDDDAAKVLAVTKCNIARMAPSLRLRLVPAPSPGPGIEVSTVRWEGATSTSANELVAPAEERGEKKRAMALLRELLADGPILAADGIKAMRHNSINERTEKRARSEMGVIAERRDKHDKSSPWMWRLPG